MNMRNLVLMALLVSSTNAFSSQQTCMLNGEVVNLNHGDSTKGKTGTVTCTDESGKIKRKFDVKNGISMGKVMMIDYQNHRLEYSQNEKGNKHGEFEEFDKDGKLVSEITYDNGKEVGLRKRYYPNGQIDSLAFEDMRIGYREDGSIDTLNCGKKPYIKEDRALCGWDKKSQVKFGSTSVNSYVDGKLVKRETYFNNGKTDTVKTMDGDKTQIKTYFETGAPKSEVKYEGNYIVNEETFFMNGNKKTSFKYEKKGDRHYKYAKEFHDTGKTLSEGTYFYPKFARYEKPVGKIKSYYEDGSPASEENYSDEGQREGEQIHWQIDGKIYRRSFYAKDVLNREILYKDGIVVSDDEILPDGSRKLK